MLRHAQFEEICASASIGQATPEELFELEQHAAHCEACRQAYCHSVDLASTIFAAADHVPALTTDEARGCLDSNLAAQRFYERAKQEGIVFSHGIEKQFLHAPAASLPFRRRIFAKKPLWAIAAMIVVGVIVTGSYRSYLSHRNPELMQYESHIAELNAANAKLQADIDHIRTELRREDGGSKAEKLSKAEREALEAQLAYAQHEISVSQMVVQSAQLKAVELRKKVEESGSILAANQETIHALTQQMSELQHQLAQSQVFAQSAEREASGLREHARETEHALMAERARTEDLAKELDEKHAAWDRERQLLAMGRDVTDLMGARNLHIVDVVDTDARGKDRAAFGRIFFTENKSLIFYAYDLNEARIEKAKFEYRIWGRKEGEIQQVRNLGIFFVDNNAQKRWVYKTKDAKLLREIDSVFVTLEPVNANPKAPTGTRLMYAYLRGSPNHQ